MTSVDFVLWVTYATYGIIIAVLLTGVFRAAQLAGGFAAAAFRRRAYWMGTLLSLLVLGTLSYFAPSSPSPTDYVGTALSYIGEIGFLGVLLVSMIFVDQNVMVLRDIDFFHRDTFGWSKVRRPFLVALLFGTGAVLFGSPVIGQFLPNEIYFPIVAVTLGYAAATLVAAARRSPDRTMRKFAILLGVSLGLGVIASTLWIPLSLVTSTEIVNFFDSIPLLASGYVLYLSVKSLSPLGKVEKEEAPEMSSPSPSVSMPSPQ